MRTSATLGLISIALAAAACGDDTSSPGDGGGGGGSTTTTTTATGTGGPTTGSTTTSTGTTTTTTTTGSGEGGAGDGGSGGSSGDGGAGGEGPGSGGSSATCDAEASDARRAAALAYGEASCAYYERCLPGFLVLLGGDPALCAAIAAATLAEISNVDDAALTTCLDDSAALFDVAECSPVPGAFVAPDSCSGVGVLAVGAPCGEAIECASGACLIEPQADCGTCVQHVDPGGACEEDVVCAPLSCVEGTCQAPQPDGTPCDAASDCEGGACAQGACATLDVAGLGEACGGLSLCDPRVPLLCDVELGECVDNPRPEPGELGGPCVDYPVDFGGGVIFTIGTCEAGTACVADTCVAAAGPGGSCAGDTICVNASCEGEVCVPPDPDVCACGE